MTTAALVFPHQLFDNHPVLDQDVSAIHLIEDSLFFGDDQYPVEFHKQKLWLHRASMKRFEKRLGDNEISVAYHEHKPGQRALNTCFDQLTGADISKVFAVDPVDFILEKRLRLLCDEHEIDLKLLTSPMFLNTAEENQDYRSEKSRWFMADYYKWQRTRMNIMMDGDDPQGGQWSFDDDNRKKVPKKKLDDIPELEFATHDDSDTDARDHVNDLYPDNPGNIDTLIYPTSHDGAAAWLDRFVKQRFDDFGPYEDAIVEGESWLWHSVLTPALNTGLLTPRQVIDTVLQHADDHDIPINSLEGFIRQIIGWREFMRATYEDLGVKMRTTNHWDHTRSIPSSFWDGTTGIDPIDDTIKRVLDTGYCHHIERLMVLGGFMFLCEFDPKEIYRWFMAMLIDSYDWVMVPNTYAMSQNADGGLITTKPYFSGSAYVKKMSHWKDGDWSEIWDGLYWRWIWQHRDELGKNPRWAMMVKNVERMDKEKRDGHLKAAANYLRSIAQS